MTAEWRHVTGRFHEFIAGLQPTPVQRRRARAAAAEIAACLRQRWRPPGAISRDSLACSGIGAPDDDYVVIGGHGKGTALRPGRAVDMLYVLPPAMRLGARPGNGGAPSVIDDLAAALNPSYVTQDSSADGWLGVKSLEETAVRLIPCFRTAGETFLIADPKSARTWRSTNPSAETTRLREADFATGGKATHLILMLKAWRQARSVDIRSLALELLVTEFVLVWTYPRRSLLFYDWMIRDFFFWARHQVRREVLTPGALECLYLGDNWVGEAEAAYRHADSACRLERDNRDIEAVRKWQEIFGPGFTGAVSPISSPDPVWLPTPDRSSSPAAP